MLPPFDPVLGQTLLDLSKSGTPQQAGRRFEILARYVLESLGPFQCRPNVLGLDVEHDLLVRNLALGDPVLASFGTYSLAECKNWGSRVDAKTLRSFISNVRAATCHTGFLFAREGITGSGESEEARQSDLRAAEFSRRKHFHSDGVVILVITEKDIASLINGASLRDLLIKEYEGVRFDERGL